MRLHLCSTVSRLLGFLTAVAHPGELWGGGGGGGGHQHPHEEDVEEDEIELETEGEQQEHTRQGGAHAPGPAGAPAEASPALAPAPAPHPVCKLVGLLCELLLPESNCGVATRVAALQGGWWWVEGVSQG